MNQTTTFRKRIDFLIKCALTATAFHSRETLNAFDALRMAKAWLGKALAAMGQSTPYTVADSPDKIPPTADTSEETVPEWADHLGAVNWMRQKISEIHLIMPAEERQRHCYQKAQDHLEEARMWYGFELQNLRESNARELTPEEFAKKVADSPLVFQEPATPEEILTAPGSEWPDPLEEQQDPFPGEPVDEDFVALAEDVPMSEIDEAVNQRKSRKKK